MLMLGSAHGIGNESMSVRNRIALLGDSMTWIGGDSCENSTGWSHWLKESGLASDIDVYARSGATWTNTKETRNDLLFYSELLHPDNVVYNQALRLIRRVSADKSTTPDMIVLFAGANDAWFSAKRPGIFDSDSLALTERFDISIEPNEVTDLQGSVALVCDVLHEYLPMADIIIVTPIQMSKVDAGVIHYVSDIIETAALSREIPVVRADRESGITHKSESQQHTYTYDGVHSNPEGAQRIFETIRPQLTALLKSDYDREDRAKTTDNTQKTTDNK